MMKIEIDRGLSEGGESTDCPYCRCAMKAGLLYTAGTAAPYWKEDGTKRDIFSERGRLPVISTLCANKIRSFYCSSCKKLIVDADLHL